MNPRGRSMLVVAVGFLVLSAALAAPTTDPAELFSKVKQATGGGAWDAIRMNHVRATITTGGLRGTVESWEDVLKGRFVDSAVLGPVSQVQGFDGKIVWSQDSSLQAHREEGGDALEGTANEAYRRSLAYWYPDRRAGTLEYAGQQDSGGRSFHVIRITPRGGRPFDLWIDAASFLIDRIVEKQAIETRTTYLSDYRSIGDVKVPFAIRSTNGETRYDQIITVESVQFNQPVDEAKFSMPAPPPPDYAFTSGKTSTTVPFELLNNHIYVQVKLNGKGPFRVLCDTGGANIVTPALASSLGLKSEGALQGRGVGEKSEDVALTRVETVQVGDVTVKNQVFAVYPLASFESVEDVPQSGLIGYEFFKRFVVRIDYEASRLTFTEPAVFKYEGRGAVVPFTYNNRIPQVEGEIDGIPGKFDIDTGSRASLSLLAPFAERHKLRERYKTRIEAVTGWGVGGAARGQVTRAESLRLGSVQVARPVTELSLQKGGAFVDPYIAGNVGAGVLKRFNVTFDYSRQTIVFEPNARNSEPDVYDRSGMWLNRKGSGFEVIDVLPGGPAEQAALRPGDLILAVDGTGADGLLLPDVRSRFRSEVPGTRIRLSVRTGDTTREVVLTLKELV